ncbi:MAG: hypothetical protein ONB23_00280 [candidate division KSB1 bacterium]|nr:hypothetical protein [candidate division KSB1 bacterium]
MRPAGKAFLFLAVFSILHFAHQVTGWSFLRVFSGTSESVFEHLKMAFWSYGVVSAVDLWLQWRAGRLEPASDLFASALTILLVPWVVAIVWYLWPGILGKTDTLAADLGWAIAVTTFAGWSGALVERELRRLEPSRTTRVLALALLAVSCFFFVRFSFGPPWLDLFVDPAVLR